MHCRCGEVVPHGREMLGLTTCLSCGALDAALQRNEMSKDVMQAYPKGGFQYLPSTSVKDTRDMRRELPVHETSGGYTRVKATPKPKRKAIGMFWYTATQRATENAILFYDKTDPRIVNAHRVVYF